MAVILGWWPSPSKTTSNCHKSKMLFNTSRRKIIVSILEAKNKNHDLWSWKSFHWSTYLFFATNPPPPIFTQNFWSAVFNWRLTIICLFHFLSSQLVLVDISVNLYQTPLAKILSSEFSCSIARKKIRTNQGFLVYT